MVLNLKKYSHRLNLDSRRSSNGTSNLKLFIFQTWHKSLRGTDSLTWGHLVIWRTFFNTQSVRLHFYNLQLHSGKIKTKTYHLT